MSNKQEEVTFSNRFVVLEPSEQISDDKPDELRFKLYCVADTKDSDKPIALAYCRTWADATFTARFLNFAEAIREEMKVQITALMAGEDKPE
jgi:hypothetical protein